LHLVFSLLTLEPGAVGGSETYARGLLAAYGAGAGPERVTVLAGPRVARSLQPLRRGPVEVRAIAEATLRRGRAGRAASLLEGMAWPPRAAVESAEDADVLHLPLTVPVPRTRRAPTVVTLFDLLYRDVPDMFGRPEQAFRRLAYERPARRAARVVTVSEHSRRRIAPALRIPPQRIVAIHPGIDHARFRPGPGENPLNGERYLLYPAALWPHKNHELLLQALSRLAGDLHLVLTGATFGRARELHRRALELRIAHRVHHLGFVAAGALPGLYRAASALVFPSLAEGFGQPVLEAMACGTPVAASNTGAVAEAAGDAAVLFDPRDAGAMAAAIERAVDDAGLREAGPARARSFTWERAAAEHLEVYSAAAHEASAANA
jgi:glycosyltransferase involved in cell wall biosynthesis